MSNLQRSLESLTWMLQEVTWLPEELLTPALTRSLAELELTLRGAAARLDQLLQEILTSPSATSSSNNTPTNSSPSQNMAVKQDGVSSKADYG